MSGSVGVDEIIAWFQNKVADYDLQIWERSVMRKELLEKLTVEGSRKSPVPEHLIDLDLVQGNSFPKAKPIEGGWRPWCQGIMFAVFMPVHASWWQARTSTFFTFILLLLWLNQIIGLSAYVTRRGLLSGTVPCSVPLSEILVPIFASILLSVLHCHIAQTQAQEYMHFTKSQRRQRRDTSDHLRRSSIFSDVGPFAGIRRFYSKNSDTGTDTDVDKKKSLRKKENIIRENQIVRNRRMRKSTDDDQSSDSTKSSRSTEHSRHNNVENIYDTIKNESSSSTSTETDDSDTDSILEPEQDLTQAPDAVKTGPERIHVRLWEEKHWVKASVSLVDLGALIMRKVFQQNHTTGPYFVVGVISSLMIAFLPMTNRVYIKYKTLNQTSITEYLVTGSYFEILETSLGNNDWYFVLSSLFSRLFTSSLSFFLLTVAQRAYQQRLTAAKHFSHITSARRARKSDLPHFRLNKVRNIKLWLSLRSYIRRRGAQRSVDIIVSSAFVMTLMLLSTVAIGFLHGSLFEEHSPVLWEITLHSVTIGLFLMQILTLGSKINKRYLNVSVLLTEQINLYLRMDRKPHKKEPLSRANAVLGLAVKLIKEIESPFKVYGLTMNPLLYNITRMVILSAFSVVVSETLGFKLKLWKIKGG